MDGTCGATGHGLALGQEMGRSGASPVAAVRQNPSCPAFQVHDCSAGRLRAFVGTSSVSRKAAQAIEARDGQSWQQGLIRAFLKSYRARLVGSYWNWKSALCLHTSLSSALPHVSSMHVKLPTCSHSTFLISQSSTIPYFMQNKDVAVEAVCWSVIVNYGPLHLLTCNLPQVTGSGKTLAFAIPVVEILLRRFVCARVVRSHHFYCSPPPGLSGGQRQRYREPLFWSLCEVHH